MNKSTKNILIIFGTRPEAIKCYPVIKALLKQSDLYNLRICVTGQHQEMLQQSLSFLSIKPDYDLKVMLHDQDSGDIVGNVLAGLKSVFKEFEPDLVLVQGDTSTALAASLCAFYSKVPIGHIEAGLRTGDNYAPWPEEGNRRLISVVASLHFAPTESAQHNLLSEGISRDKIFVTGNTVVDTVQDIRDQFRGTDNLIAQYASKFSFLNPNSRWVLVTGHRRESFGPGIENICHAIKEIVKKHDDVEVIYPVHLNPKVRGVVYDILGNSTTSDQRIHLTNPLDYFSFVYLMTQSYMIMTDSGGIQEESPSLGIPLLIMRDVTERPEAVESGCALLVGVDRENIVREVDKLLMDVSHHSAMSKARNPFGDGQAGGRIVKILSEVKW